MKKLARAAFDLLLPAIDLGERPLRLDAIVPDEPEDVHRPGELRRRMELVAPAFLDLLKQKRRRTHRMLTDDPAATRIQLLLVGRDRILASLSDPARLPGGQLWPSPFPAGRAEVPEDRRAPSSAYRKLLEALLWTGRRIEAGERCVDLGSAPGGWTFVALKEGAHVISVDRADLDVSLYESPRLFHRRGDAFSYVPPDPPVDWLLCDVIAYPDRSLSLLSTWVRERWCEKLVFHLKFRGREDYGPAFAARDLLREHYLDARAKHLTNDRNEVTLMATERRPDRSGEISRARPDRDQTGSPPCLS